MGFASLPGAARAEPMDLALSHLRIPGGTDACALPEGRWCPNQLLFERLMSEIGMAAAGPVLQPAHTPGARGLQIAVQSTTTTIDADGAHWVRGSEGDGLVAGELSNNSRSTALTYNRIAVRKGLPLGLELGADVGRAVQRSDWVVGVSAKFALLEGFRTGLLGLLPDVALRGHLGWVLGGHQTTLSAHGLDLLLSKPIGGPGAWILSPLGGVQLLWLRARSGLVDLAPQDVWNCQAADPDCDPTTASEDVVRFDPLSQLRVRLSAGVEARRDWLLVTAVAAYAPWPPSVGSAVEGGTAATQLSFSAAAGIQF